MRMQNLPIASIRIFSTLLLLLCLSSFCFSQKISNGFEITNNISNTGQGQITNVHLQGGGPPENLSWNTQSIIESNTLSMCFPNSEPVLDNTSNITFPYNSWTGNLIIRYGFNGPTLTTIPLSKTGSGGSTTIYFSWTAPATTLTYAGTGPYITACGDDGTIGNVYEIVVVQTVYYNTPVSQTYTPSCSSGYYSTGPVTYTVPGNEYASFSPGDANTKAGYDLQRNGQNYANANGCVICPAPITTAPTNLLYTYFSNANTIALTWNAVPTATSYCVLLQDLTAGTGLEVCAAYPTTNGVSANVLHLVNGHTYKAAVIADNQCSTSPQSAFYTFTVGPPPCPPTYVANVEALGGGVANVAWSSISQALSYNIKFVNGSYTKLFSNYVPVGNPNTGINFTGIPPGPYTVSVQCNCAPPLQSTWASYFSQVQISAIKNNQQLLSAQTTDDASSSNTKFSVYPVPSSSQVNILYNAPANGRADIIIMNALGSTVSHKTIGITAGTNNYQINVSEFANGVYIIKLVDGVNIHVQKLMVVK